MNTSRHKLDQFTQQQRTGHIGSVYERSLPTESSRRALVHPNNPYEIGDGSKGLETADTEEIDVVTGPPANDPPYDGWKKWYDTRGRYYHDGDEEWYAYRFYRLYDLNGDMTFESAQTRVIVEPPEE